MGKERDVMPATDDIILTKLRKILVGARGFEPRTPCAQGRCATRLRYAQTLLNIAGLNWFVKVR